MPQLTEQEQQEIIRFVEAGDKTSEVCNIVLPFQVIEQVNEPRAEKPEKQDLQTDRNQRAGRFGCAAEDGAAAAMV